MKKDFLAPIGVLTAICLVVSAILAFTNLNTEPIILATELASAQAARIEMLPEADSFSPLELPGLPESVTEAYTANNGAGYVFLLSVKGYGGKIKLICGIDEKGLFTGTKTLSHTETQGLGARITEESFRLQFMGKDSSLDGVSTISGASISSGAYIGAIKDALAAYSLATEAV